MILRLHLNQADFRLKYLFVINVLRFYLFENKQTKIIVANMYIEQAHWEKYMCEFCHKS